MKSIAKVLLVGAVAMTAMSFSAPSFAAKKAASACVPGWTCTARCKGGVCNVNACNYEGKWSKAVFTPACSEPFCPPKC
jgi:hypothetical protein